MASFTATAAGKTIVITGGAGGLGKVVATTFLEAGANVAIFDVNDDRLKETAAGWEKHGDKFIATKTDITDETAVNAFFASVSAKFGRIDMLINNAGVMDKFDPAGSLPMDIWNRVIGVNLTGAYLCTKAAVNAFEAQSPSGGTIISICSVASVRGLNAGAAYTASKHGLMGLVRNTASFYGPKGIYSVAFLMGGMNTNIVDVFATGYNEEGMAAMNNANPGFVVGKTHVELTDVAKYCLFYTDPAIAESSNGATISISKNWPSV
ncbi:putative short chain dehydrogenase protein [Rosellinia necatrix]|uniref:Putative short chain dehydrogenase protein n=1 Tax=Rosellinia necatrix TaxID=77044 RepID=A0A1W2TWW7_ROSNE|nr:putative short chain dehydrogenase protein [Rosellinia necatrix]